LKTAAFAPVSQYHQQNSPIFVNENLWVSRITFSACPVLFLPFAFGHDKERSTVFLLFRFRKRLPDPACFYLAFSAKISILMSLIAKLEQFSDAKL
jgi:hypothetical protein